MPRNPYPFPRLENDDNFVKGNKKLVIGNSQKFSDNKGGEDQWNRLFRTETLSSKRREVLHFDPQAPNDSLDFVIKSTYNHHGEFLSSNAETLVQPETQNYPHGRILKNRPPPAGPKIDLNKLPLRISSSNKKESVHSVTGAIDPTTYYTSCSDSGSMGWVAYECMDWDMLYSPYEKSSDADPKQFKWKEKSDIQVAGMLAFFILTKGNHPFGAKILRLQNMYYNNPVGLEQLTDPVVKDLLSQMLDRDLDRRPYVEQALKHPYFLSAEEKMKLVQTMGNEREIKEGDVQCGVVKLLDNLDPSQPRSRLLPPDWKALFDPDDLNTLCMEGKPPSRLDGSRYTHCLRLIRNVFQHWGDRKPRPALKDMRQATCLEEYFLQLFPTLPLVLYQIIRDRDDWKTRLALKEFYPEVNRRTEAS